MRLPSAQIIGAALFVAMGAAALPTLLSAQTEAELREEVRTAIMNDTRTAALSPQEVHSVIDSLTQAIQSSGQAADFLAPSVFFEQLVELPVTQTRTQLSMLALYALVILSLGMALLFLHHAHARHRARA